MDKQLFALKVMKVLDENNATLPVDEHWSLELHFNAEENTGILVHARKRNHIMIHNKVDSDAVYISMNSITNAARAYGIERMEI